MVLAEALLVTLLGAASVSLLASVFAKALGTGLQQFFPVDRNASQCVRRRGGARAGSGRAGGSAAVHAGLAAEDRRRIEDRSEPWRRMYSQISAIIGDEPS